jgi:hypothetical protein
MLASMLYDAAVGKDDCRPLACHFFVLSCAHQARVWEVDASGYVQEVRAAARGKGQADLRQCLEDFIGNRVLSVSAEASGNRTCGGPHHVAARDAMCERMARALSGGGRNNDASIRSEYFEIV